MNYTVHGDAIAFGEEVYFSQNVDLYGIKSKQTGVVIGLLTLKADNKSKDSDTWCVVKLNSQSKVSLEKVKEGLKDALQEVIGELNTLEVREGMKAIVNEYYNSIAKKLLPVIVVVSKRFVKPVKIIKFMNDHCTTSLWWDSHGKVGPLEYDELPLSKELVDLLEKRDEEYTNRLNWEDPGSTPDPTEEELKAFETEGIDLWRRLQEELKPFYKVTFFSEVLRRVVETKAELNAQAQS